MAKTQLTIASAYEEADDEAALDLDAELVLDDSAPSDSNPADTGGEEKIERPKVLVKQASSFVM